MKTNFLAAGIFLTALVNALGQPAITSQPQSVTNVAGTTATFSVTVTGTPSFAYQWVFNSTTALWAGTNAELTLTNVQSFNAGGYSVIVTNVEGAVTSAVANLTVLVPPVITRQPANLSLSLGATATFSVSATGTTPLAYQWQFNGAGLANATNRTVSVTNIQLSRAGNYFAVVANAAGSVTSRVAVLEVDATFTKITSGPIVTDGGLSARGSWVDYDDDGYLDLLVPNTAGTKIFLYHNERNGSFTRITDGDIVNTPRDYRNAAWFDYDNDGHIDLYIGSNGAYGTIGPWNYLYRNNGDGTFTSMPSNVVGNLVGPHGLSENSFAADYDLDGFLDLFVTRSS